MSTKCVAFVPIKLNSERLPGKNILPFGDHCLCWHIFESLLSINIIDDVFVYCSDEKITNFVPNSVKFLKRDKRLDDSLTKGIDIYTSFAEDINADVYILAHATAPFLNASSIEKGLRSVLEDGYDSSFSAQEVRTFAWFRGNPINYCPSDIPRTQDMDPIIVETSGFYIFKRSVLLQHGRRIGFHPHIQMLNHIEAVDIDTEEDLKVARFFLG